MISIQRSIRKIQPVSRHHDSIQVYIHTHGAVPGACILQASCPNPSSGQARQRGVAQNEVAWDVWRPVAPVIAYVRGPVAAVGEAKDGGGFGDESGGGELLEITIGVCHYLFSKIRVYFKIVDFPSSVISKEKTSPSLILFSLQTCVGIVISNESVP